MSHECTRVTLRKNIYICFFFTVSASASPEFLFFFECERECQGKKTTHLTAIATWRGEVRQNSFPLAFWVLQAWARQWSRGASGW